MLPLPHLRTVIAFLVAIGSLGLLAWMPAFISFGLTVAAALGWCIWLERHP